MVSEHSIGIVGQTLGTAGNTGEVFAGGRYVTREEKIAGSRAGTHLHGPQVRPCRKLLSIRSDRQYLVDGNGILMRDGFYFEVIDYGNGYNGCIDPAPLYNGFLAVDAPKVRSYMSQAIVLLQLRVKELMTHKSA